MNIKNKLLLVAIIVFFGFSINTNAASLSATKYSEMKYKYTGAASLTETITRLVKYDRYKGGFTTTFCISGNQKCVVKQGKINFPTNLTVNNDQYQGKSLTENLGSPIVPADKEVVISSFVPYFCEYGNENDIFKLRFDVDGSTKLYFNNSNITSQLQDSFTANSHVFETSNVTKLDNLSDYDSSTGVCPSYVYYRPMSSIKLYSNNINVTYALFTETTNGDTYVGFNVLDFKSEETKLLALTSNNGSSNNGDGSVVGGSIDDVSGCGIMGDLLDSNGIVSRIIGLVNVFLIAGLIVLGMVDFLKAVSSSDEKAYSKAMKKTTNRIIIAIIIILLPILVDFFVRTFFSDFTKSCLDQL